MNQCLCFALLLGSAVALLFLILVYSALIVGSREVPHPPKAPTVEFHQNVAPQERQRGAARGVGHWDPPSAASYSSARASLLLVGGIAMLDPEQYVLMIILLFFIALSLYIVIRGSKDKNHW